MGNGLGENEKYANERPGLPESEERRAKSDKAPIRREDEIRNISSASTMKRAARLARLDGARGTFEERAGKRGLHYALKGCRFKSKRIGIVNNETEAPENGS